jgi:hypothetical protein
MEGKEPYLIPMFHAARGRKLTIYGGPSRAPYLLHHPVVDAQELLDRAGLGQAEGRSRCA